VFVMKERRSNRYERHSVRYEVLKSGQGQALGGTRQRGGLGPAAGVYCDTFLARRDLKLKHGANFE